MKSRLFKSSTEYPAPDPSQWVARHADYLFSYALTRLGDGEMCRDLVQETLLAALEQLSEYRGESSERTWLTAILKYKVIAVYRKRGASRLTPLDAEESEPGYFEAGNGHWRQSMEPRPMSFDDADPTHRRELAGILERCLRRLPALWQVIFSMKHMDELEGEVICREMKLTSSNYWVILHRAKVNLRACVQKSWL
jgi:RNA polymerase sigma-70 factor (TIGR02943 family)